MTSESSMHYSGVNQALEIRNRSESLERIRLYVDKLSEMSAQVT